MNNEIPDELRDQIKDACTTLILGNKRLTAKDAARFPTVPYNYIQHVYRTVLHDIETQQESFVKSHIHRINSLFNANQSLESIAAQEHLLLPILLRAFLKCNYANATTTVEGLLQNPSLIGDLRVRETVRRCNAEGTTDVLRHDLVRMSSGLEYEYILKEQLRNHDVLFLSEAAARSEGLSKTPDVVLQFPISILCDQYPVPYMFFFLHTNGLEGNQLD